jgi:hypothetical protein
VSWSYSDSLTTNKDKVRLKIGDTDTNDQLLSNETIEALLTEHNNDLDLTAISCVRAIIAQFNRTIDRNAAGMTANYSKNYLPQIEATVVHAIKAASLEIVRRRLKMILISFCHSLGLGSSTTQVQARTIVTRIGTMCNGESSKQRS